MQEEEEVKARFIQRAGPEVIRGLQNRKWTTGSRPSRPAL